MVLKGPCAFLMFTFPSSLISTVRNVQSNGVFETPNFFPSRVSSGTTDAKQSVKSSSSMNACVCVTSHGLVLCVSFARLYTDAFQTRSAGTC